jgi:hypothetical protein
LFVYLWQKNPQAPISIIVTSSNVINSVYQDGPLRIE